MNIDEVLNQDSYSKQDIISLLSIEESGDFEKLRQAAYSVMKNYCGEEVHLRGLVEFSNICTNDCYYCGIRKSNKNIKRYTLEQEEVIEAAVWCAEQGYGSFVLQSGERSDEKFITYVEDVVRKIKQSTISERLPNGLGITLCVGEQTLETYQRFFDAGAHRYLLRIETSSADLYNEIHPPEQDYYRRVDCLFNLKKVGFQVGTGVMIGFPGQSIEDLANDILFFKAMDIDMIGMGPFIVHQQTPFSEFENMYSTIKDKIYKLALKMIGVTRLVLKDVNIASTTALQAMYPMGREAGLEFGANVIMPMLTPTYVRKEYQLYDGKPCVDEFASECFDCMKNRIESTGREIGYDDWGDSRHFINKNKHE